MAELADFYRFDSKAGIVVPDTSKVRDAVVDVFRNALGANLDTSAETHVGRLVDALTVGFSSAIGLNAQNASQLNPKYATGQWLDNVAELFGISRKGQTYTTVTAKLSGNPGAIVPAGSLAQTVVDGESTGYYFATQSDTTIGLYGYADAIMVCTVPGAVKCTAGTLTKIASSVVGWTAVSNLVSGVEGREEENDAALRSRLLNGRSFGIGAVESIRNAVEALDCVSSMTIFENGDANPKTINSVSVSAHSIFCCIEYVESEENRVKIANAILSSKTAGCGYSEPPYSDIEVSQDVELGGTTYNVKWCKPEAVSVPVTVSVVNIGYTGTTLEQDIKDSVSQYFAENIGVGDDVSVYNLSAYVIGSVNGIYVSDIKISGATGASAAGYQKLLVSSISVSIVSQ